MTRCSRRCQYAKTHLDEDRLIAPKQGVSPSVVRRGGASINRTRMDEEHQQRVPEKVLEVVEGIIMIIKRVLRRRQNLKSERQVCLRGMARTSLLELRAKTSKEL
uniref:Uncharacterized protein n=1 Tax=Cannabis sativa TaxID=3483 RepID=A0A803QPQ7_CANSA